MRGDVLFRSPARRRAAVALLACAGTLPVSGCEQVRMIARPELAQCERFIRARMKAPGSFERHWYHIGDMGLTRAQFAAASGNAALARSAPDPGIRKVLIQYGGEGLYSERTAGVGLCLFPMSDAAKAAYATNLDDMVDAAIRRNEERTLLASVGTEGVVAAQCCAAEGFDPHSLDKVPVQRRGTVSAGRPM